MAVWALMLAVLAVASAETYPRIGAGFRAQRPPTFDSWHPAVRTLKAYVAYNRALIARLNESSTETISVMRHEKEILAQAHLEHFGPAHLRRFNAQDFINGFVNSVENAGTAAALNAATGGLYGCAHDLVDDVISLYNYFENGVDESIADTVSQIAHTVSDCLSGTVSNIPILGTIVSFIKIACNADDIYNSCKAFISDLNSQNFNDYQVGSDLGTCVTTIATDARRRRLAALRQNVPSTWLCEPGFYNSSDGCDIGCGAFDPDCYSGTQKTFYPRGRLVAPKEWHCPVAYYGADDGCDAGCGARDPDCGQGEGKRTATYTWSAAQDFTIEAYAALAATLQATGQPNAAASSGTDPQYQTAAVAVGTVLGASLLVLGALVYAFRRKKNLARAQAAQLAMLLPEGNGDGEESTEANPHASPY